MKSAVMWNLGWVCRSSWISAAPTLPSGWVGGCGNGDGVGEELGWLRRRL